MASAGRAMGVRPKSKLGTARPSSAITHLRPAAASFRKRRLGLLALQLAYPGERAARCAAEKGFWPAALVRRCAE